MKNFEYGYPHTNALLQSHLKLELRKPHKAAYHLTKCDIVNDVKLFPTVYCRIYSRKFLTLSNQTSRYKSKCIRISYQSAKTYLVGTQNDRLNEYPKHVLKLMGKKIFTFYAQKFLLSKPVSSLSCWIYTTLLLQFYLI